MCFVKSTRFHLLTDYFISQVRYDDTLVGLTFMEIFGPTVLIT